MGAKLSGSSGKKYGIEQNADINVTPFVDVMLVLLIIFMVAAPLATQSLKLDLPPPVTTPPKTKVPVILVEMVDTGDISLAVRGDTSTLSKTSLTTLTGDLSRLFAQVGLTKPDDQKVNITATKHVRYGAFMDVLNTLEKAGYTHVNLVIT